MESDRCDGRTLNRNKEIQEELFWIVIGLEEFFCENKKEKMKIFYKT